MTDPPSPTPRKARLNVLVSSSKLDELKEQFTMDAANTSPSPSPPEPAAPAPPPASADYTPHVNKVRFSDAPKSPAQLAIEEQIVKQLRTVFDPEIPVNIYELGLIYDIDIDADASVLVRMTLTAPGCPVAGSLISEVERKIESIPAVRSSRVELVWEPQWVKEMMSEVARMELGMW